MFVFIWATLLFSVRASNADTGASIRVSQHCSRKYCITLPEGEITTEAGLCVVIPCSFTNAYGFTPQDLVWYKCEPTKPRCSDSDVIFHTNKKNTKVQPEFSERVSLLEPDVNQKNCSIIINDLKESDSGSYQLRIDNYWFGRQYGFTYPYRATVSIKGVSQKPTLMIPPLTEGQQTTLTCTAPGHCSGSEPEITWTWRRAGENSSHITGNITDFKIENLTAFTQEHSSTLTFTPSVEHHGTEVTCKVSFTGMTTEKTVTLSVNCSHGLSLVPLLTVAVLSIIGNILFIIYFVFLRNSRKEAKPAPQDRTYMSLKKAEISPEYDVIVQTRK